MINVSSPADRGTTERDNRGEGASTPTSPNERAPRIEAAIPSDLSTIDHYCADLQTVLRDELLTSSPSIEEYNQECNELSGEENDFPAVQDEMNVQSNANDDNFELSSPLDNDQENSNEMLVDPNEEDTITDAYQSDETPDPPPNNQSFNDAAGNDNSLPLEEEDRPSPVSLDSNVNSPEGKITQQSVLH